MKYPLINKNDHYPDEAICPICNKNKVFEPHSFVVFEGGSFLLNKKGDSINNDQMDGYLNFLRHGHHYEGIEDENKDTMAMLEIVKGSTYGQFSMYFCSTECLRVFLNELVDDFEKEIMKSREKGSSK